VIVLVNPRVTKPRYRRFPLSVMALGAALPEDTTWEIVDENQPRVDGFERVTAMIDAGSGGRDPVRAIAMTVMPGPQLASAVPLARRLKEQFPTIPMIWGGYFPSLYPEPVLAASYVDWVVRGQGEQTFLELLEVLAGERDPKSVAGLAFSDDGVPWIGPERAWRGPNELPPPPYAKIDVDDYIHPTFLGRRSAIYQASIGCPYSCNFCGVIAAYGSRQKLEDPARTVEHVSYLVKHHHIDSLHFYDNNFFLKEDHTVELCERLKPLGLSWWCEARIDAMLRFSDRTWELIKQAGLKMVFLGAESGSDAVLRKMSKHLTTDQIIAIAEKTRAHDIIPEFSFIFGGPDDPEAEVEATLALARRLKTINPAMELVPHFYTPTPQRSGTWGNVDPLQGTPLTLEQWAEPAWVRWSSHEDPDLPWMPRALKARVQNFELVLKSRFPSVNDLRTRSWGKKLASLVAKRRWEQERYENPRLLRAIRRWARPPDRYEYGHLRPSTAGQ
jgi:radical SAM superfamily enzyme YgiQ (UPF0313 family)